MQDVRGRIRQDAGAGRSGGDGGACRGGRAGPVHPGAWLALCHLLDGEKSVGRLAELVGLSPAALSQHLARMRDQRLVEARRDGQTIYYRVASRELREILETLYRLYCAPQP